jgi:hypothetical protein
LVLVLFRKKFGAGPSQKKFWSRSGKKKFVPDPVPPGLGPGPLCPSLVEMYKGTKLDPLP